MARLRLTLALAVLCGTGSGSEICPSLDFEETQSDGQCPTGWSCAGAAGEPDARGAAGEPDAAGAGARGAGPGSEGARGPLALARHTEHATEVPAAQLAPAD